MARTATYDPMEKFRFVVDFNIPTAGNAGGNGTTAVRLGFHDVQMPKRTTNKIHYREGHNPTISSLSAGLSTMEDVVMSRGAIASDGASANDFYNWIRRVHAPSNGVQNYGKPGEDVADGGAGSLGDINYRSAVSITMLDRGGSPVRSWTLANAFPVHFVPGSDLNAAEDGEKSIEALTLTYEDFQEMQVVGGAVSTTPL